MHRLFDELGDGVCVADAQGRLVYSNPAARRLLALGEAPAQGLDFCRRVCGHAAGESFDCPLRRAGRKGAAKDIKLLGRRSGRAAYRWRGESVRRTGSGRDLRLRCLRDSIPWLGDDPHAVVLIEDVTAELELQRHKDDWRDMAAKELRDPLNSVYSALSLIDEEQAKRAPPAAAGRAAEAVALGLRSCRRMLELLELSLDVAQLDAGAWPLSPADLDVLHCVEDAVASKAMAALRRGVALEVEVEKGLQVRADAVLLGRVLDNLLDNAVKFCLDGGRVRVLARGRDGAVELSVQDAGPGIAEQDLPFLFDRFYQAEARRAGRIRGAGLGLTFCLEALKLMEGDISAAPAPGGGARFTVILPRAAAPSNGVH